MATIRATCTDCGDVELSTADVRVRLDAFHQGSYSFVCPHCDTTIVKPAQPRTIDLLLASGVDYEIEAGPGEQDHEDPPLDEHDCDLFCTLLADDDLLWTAFEEADSRHRRKS